MERNTVINEFLNLRKQLNQGNKLANEATEFQFELEELPKSEYRLLAVVFGRQDKNRIEIARRDRHGEWERSGYTKYRNFENFCSDFLNKKEIETRLLKTNYGHENHFNLIEMINKLQNEFNDLLIDYDS